MTYEVPPADTDNLKKDANIKVLKGPETRIVFLGFDQERRRADRVEHQGQEPLQGQACP